VDEQCVNGLDELTAAVEFGPTGLEWEPNRRSLIFDQVEPEGPVAWSVYDIDGHLVEGSRDVESPLAEKVPSSETTDQFSRDLKWHNERWRIVKRTVRADTVNPRVRNVVPPLVGKLGKNRYAALVMMIGVPIEPALRPLSLLATSLIGLSLFIWLLAALLGRWLCRKALTPIALMARTAHSITADDLSQRLPPAGTHDELDDLGSAFNDLLTRLQDSFQQQKCFTGEASHQLRTPLTAMLGQIEVALRRDRPTEDYRRVLESTHRQAERLRQIIETLLFLARDDAETSAPALEVFELRDWLTDHLHSWDRHPRRPDIQLAAEGKFWIHAHRVLLGEAINNLLDNACKYSQSGSPILIHIFAAESQIQLVVEDRGFGIPQNELPLIFGSFFRSPSARQRGISGTGLGLTVVERIVTAFEGSLRVESSEGKGSRLVISLAAANTDTPAKLSVNGMSDT
jgi:heavy metal sensor kinase